MSELTIRPWDRDDAMIERATREQRPLHAVNTVDEFAVVLGRGGKVERELIPAAIAADGVPVYRRRGGGCAVVLDPGNIVISLALPLPGLGHITRAFTDISRMLCTVLDQCGVPGVEQRGVSDLSLHGRKLGGSCIHRVRGLVYYSTTLLVAPDRDLIERYLTHPPREPEYRQGRAHREFLISLDKLEPHTSTTTWCERITSVVLTQNWDVFNHI